MPTSISRCQPNASHISVEITAYSSPTTSVSSSSREDLLVYAGMTGKICVFCPLLIIETTNRLPLLNCHIQQPHHCLTGSQSKKVKKECEHRRCERPFQQPYPNDTGTPAANQIAQASSHCLIYTPTTGFLRIHNSYSKTHAPSHHSSLIY